MIECDANKGMNYVMTGAPLQQSLESSESCDDPSLSDHPEQSRMASYLPQSRVSRKYITQQIVLEDWQDKNPVGRSTCDAKRRTGHHHRVRSTSTDTDAIHPVLVHHETQDSAPGETDLPNYGQDEESETPVFEEV